MSGCDDCRWCACRGRAGVHGWWCATSACVCAPYPREASPPSALSSLLLVPLPLLPPSVPNHAPKSCSSLLIRLSAMLSLRGCVLCSFLWWGDGGRVGGGGGVREASTRRKGMVMVWWPLLLLRRRSRNLGGRPRPPGASHTCTHGTTGGKACVWGDGGGQGGGRGVGMTRGRPSLLLLR